MNAMFNDTPSKPGQLYETVMMAKEAVGKDNPPLTLVLTIPHWDKSGFAFLTELEQMPQLTARKLWTFSKGQYCFRHGAAEASWKEKYCHAKWDTDL